MLTGAIPLTWVPACSINAFSNFLIASDFFGVSHNMESGSMFLDEVSDHICLISPCALFFRVERLQRINFFEMWRIDGIPSPPLFPLVAPSSLSHKCWPACLTKSGHDLRPGNWDSDRSKLLQTVCFNSYDTPECIWVYWRKKSSAWVKLWCSMLMWFPVKISNYYKHHFLLFLYSCWIIRKRANSTDICSCWVHCSRIILVFSKYQRIVL